MQNNNNEWTKEIESFTIDVMTKCRIRRLIHVESAAWYRKWYNIITILSIMFGAIITAVSQLPVSSDAMWYRYTVGLLSLAVTTTSAIVKFLDYSEKRNAHQIAAISLMGLRNTILVQLVKPPLMRISGNQFVEDVSKSFQTIVKSSPPGLTSVISRLRVESPEPDTDIPRWMLEKQEQEYKDLKNAKEQREQKEQKEGKESKDPMEPKEPREPEEGAAEPRAEPRTNLRADVRAEIPIHLHDQQVYDVI